jgi:hypothetical protein
MIKNRILLTASVSVIFGIMIGVLGTAWVWMQTTTEFAKVGALAKTEADIITKVDLLEHLRSGQYNDATKQLEALLDMDLIGAAEFAREGIEFGSDTLKALETERTARKISGYEPVSSTVGVGVHDVFSLVPQSKIAMRSTPIIMRDDKCCNN